MPKDFQFEPQIVAALKRTLWFMGPGGYRFGDYWRMGLPLEFLIVGFSVPLILLFWPF